MTKQDILKMIFVEGGDSSGEYNDKYYFTPNNSPIKNAKDLFIINNKLNTMYGYLLGSFQAKLKDLKSYMSNEEIVTVRKDIKLCREVIKNLLNTCREIIEKSEDELTEDAIDCIYKASNQEMDEIYRIVPDYVKKEFSIIIRS